MIDNTLRSQSIEFLENEGDAWFERNKLLVSNDDKHYDIEFIKRILNPFKININSILEIGCSSGVKLEELSAFFNADGYGVDPSTLAVQNGNDRISQNYLNDNIKQKIKLEVSTSAKLRYLNASFDLVHFGFCLYLVDRDEIFSTVAEADRVLKKGGFLTIVDFDPIKRHKRSYHHKEGIFSYKTSYSDFFLNSGHYYLVAKESFSHVDNYFSFNSDERVSVSVLYKEIESY